MSVGKSIPITFSKNSAESTTLSTGNSSIAKAPISEPELKPQTIESLELAPDQLLPAASARIRLLWYFGSVLLTAILLFMGHRLDQMDLHSPLDYDGDTLLILPMVKATIERGSHWRNERLGYPGIQELHDFPVIDHLHFAIIWLMGRFISDYVLVYNLYFLLTWPLTTLTAMYAFRRLHLTLPAAAVGATLYAFMPYHYLRGESHYFLAAYWVIPLSCLPALAICKGIYLPFMRSNPARISLSFFSRESLWQVVLALATASGGAYYAFFACSLYGISGLYGLLAQRSVRPLISAGLIITFISLFGIINHLPTFFYVAEYGRNSATERTPEEAESYGLKIAQLVLPVDAHNLTFFSQIKSSYNSAIRPCCNENGCATLGIVGTAGLLILVVTLLFPSRRNWPFGPLVTLSGFILLFGSIGGFGSIFNLMIFDQIRCFNRYSIYLAFFCLLAILWPIDQFLASRTGRLRWFRLPIFVALLVLGISDQTPTPWFSSQIVKIIDRQAERFQADRRFFSRIEEAMPAGAKILNMPYMKYPEVPPLYGLKTYEHIRGYLHTQTLIWSFGTMKNREVDEWLQMATVDKKGDEVLQHAVLRGFEGILIDKRGFAVTDQNGGDKLIDQINRHAARAAPGGLPAIVHEDGRQVFLDIRPYRDWLIREDPVSFEADQKRERETIVITWLYGFFSPEPYGSQDKIRWGYRKATAVIVNPSDRTRTLRLAMTYGIDTPGGEYRILVEGINLNCITDGKLEPWRDEIVLEAFEQEGEHAPPPVHHDRRTYLIELPPGRHTVKFRCITPPKFMPADPKPICFYLKDIKFSEVK